MFNEKEMLVRIALGHQPHETEKALLSHIKKYYKLPQKNQLKHRQLITPFLRSLIKITSAKSYEKTYFSSVPSLLNPLYPAKYAQP